MSNVLLKRRKSLPPNYKFHSGFLSPSLENKEETLMKDVNILQFKDTKIHQRLLSKLEKSRKHINDEDNIYISEEHRLMCYYNKKLMELKKKLNIKNKQIDIKYKANILVNNSERETFEVKRKEEGDALLDFKDITYKYIIKYNEYNKKFINKIQEYIDVDNLNNFIEQQNNFLEKLSIREIYNLKYYTYRGDIYINSYIDTEIFQPQIIKETGGDIVDDDSDLCYYFFQFLDYFKINNNYKGEEVPTEDDTLFIKFIQDNYLDFDKDIYKFIFDLYIKELKVIFDKAPRTQNRLVLYRGINENYVSKQSKKGYYISNHFSSTSLFPEIAYNYTKKKKIILKIIVEKGQPLIYVEGITLAKGDYEVIMPIHSTLYIDYALKKVGYYKTKDELCPVINDDNSINMTTVIYMKYNK